MSERVSLSEPESTCLCAKLFYYWLVVCLFVMEGRANRLICVAAVMAQLTVPSDEGSESQD